MLRAPALALVVATVGCSGEDSPPSTLADGSPARPPPVALEGVEGPSVATRVRVVTRESVERRSQTARCVGSAVALGAGIVVRVGVDGASVTFPGRDGRSLYGCDSASRPGARSSWCGHAFGRLYGGRLRDPRLSIGCRTSEGELLGFAWVQPLPRAAYVVVARSGYYEAHRVAGDVPVRVTTDDVDLARSTALFAVSEHALDGRRLRTYELEARVSG